MKITQEEVVDNQTTLRIELEEADLPPYLDRGYRRLAPRISIPGFRKGKVPRNVVEGVMGRESLLNEVLDNMVYEVTSKAIEEREIDATGTPKIEDLDFDPVSFTATVALRPEVELGDYRAIRLPYAPDEITDEIVSRRIDDIRASLGTWETVERPPRIGDLVGLDARGEVEGEVFWVREDGVLYLDEEGSVPVSGFPQAIAGMEPGQETEFTLPIPEDFRDDSIAGKDASFTVTISEVRERNLPELNDDFAQGLPDQYDSVEDLREKIKESMIADAQTRLEQEYETNVIRTLIDDITIAVPPVMLENETNRILNREEELFERMNMRRDDYLRSVGKTEGEARQDAEKEAEERIKRTFALNKISELENIEVTEQEIDERFNQMYAGQRVGRRERRRNRESVDDMLKYEKTIAFLVEIAKSEEAKIDAEPQDVQEGDAQDDE